MTSDISTFVLKYYILLTSVLLAIFVVCFDVYVANTEFSDEISALVIWRYALYWFLGSVTIVTLAQILRITRVSKKIVLYAFVVWFLCLYNLHIINKNSYLPDSIHYEKSKDDRRLAMSDKKFWLSLLPW
jgi:hypothetical protein